MCFWDDGRHRNLEMGGGRAYFTIPSPRSRIVCTLAFFYCTLASGSVNRIHLRVRSHGMGCNSVSCWWCRSGIIAMAKTMCSNGRGRWYWAPGADEIGWHGETRVDGMGRYRDSVLVYGVGVGCWWDG